MVEKVVRVREMYNWFLSNPCGTDREFVSEVMQRHSVSKVTANSDLAVVKTLMPMLASASRDFHRWRFNELIMKTYAKAQAKGDTKTMERAEASYAKYNRVDLEDEQTLPYELIVVQPFTATDDPTVLGIKPIPNIQPRQISDMIAKYRAETLDTMLNSVTRWIFPFGKPTAKYFTCIIASRSATIFMPVLAILNCLRRGKSAKSEIVASFP